ncbi:MAG: carboxypeptidase-like regulatory domain-containing protein [Planctomycetota bacterium]
MRREPNGRTDVLERNVAALLEHAYRPVRVRPAFERELREQFIEALAAPRPRRGAPWVAPLVAAAAALLAWLGVRAALAPPAESVDLASDPGAQTVADRQATAGGLGDRPAGTQGSSAPEAPRGVERQPIGEAVAGELPPVEPGVDLADETACVQATITPPTGVQGLDGLRVTLLRVAEMPQVEDPVLLEGTAANGGWRFDGLPSGLHRLFVKTDASATWRTTVELRAGEELALDVELIRGVTARGRVVDSTGAPVEGALVVSETDVPMQVLSARVEEFEEQGAVFTLTDVDGRFALGPLEPGPHVLRASASGHAPAWVEAEVNADLDPRNEPTLSLRAPGRIAGRVTDDFGAPDAGAVVVGSLFLSEGGGAKRLYAYDIADEEGRYTLDDLPPGMFVVLLFDGTGDVMRRMSPTQLDLGGARTIDFVADTQASTLGGRLVDPEGRPLAGRVVTVVRIDDGTELDSDEWRAVNTAEDGSFRVADLDPGRYGLLTDPEPGLDMTLVQLVEVGRGSDVELRVVVSASGLSGTIRDPDGAPQPGLALLMREDAEATLFAGRDLASADGRFAFRGLPHGRYRLTVFPFLPGAAAAIDVPYVVDGSDLDVELELDPGAALDVRCVTPDGAPVADAQLVLTAPSGRRLPDDGRLRTELDGRYRVLALAEGEWTLEVRHQGHQPLERRVRVTLDGPNAIELTLTPR